MKAPLITSSDSSDEFLVEELGTFAETGHAIRTDHAGPTGNTFTPATALRHRTSILETNPTEVAAMVVDEMEIADVMKLPQVALTLRELIWSLPIMVQLKNIGAGLLETVFRIGYRGTLSQLLNLVRSDECGLCGRFAAHLSPLTQQRCCWSCASSNIRLKVIGTPQAVRTLSLTPEQVSWLPQIPRLRLGDKWEESTPDFSYSVG